MNNTTSSSLQKLSVIFIGINEYSISGAAAKETMHKAGKSFLSGLAVDLGLKKDDYTIRSNKGGIAVSGEVTLHAENIYIQISESFSSGKSVSILYRNCQSQKDHAGGKNHFTNAKDLSEGAYEHFVANCKVLILEAQAANPRQKIKPAF